MSISADNGYASTYSQRCQLGVFMIDSMFACT
jgi:hypothetical protein